MADEPTTLNDSIPFPIPEAKGWWQSMVLALFVHALLFIFLLDGIRWKNKPPEIIDAEVWDFQVRDAAPSPSIQLEQNKDLPVEKPDIVLAQHESDPVKRPAEGDKKGPENEKEPAGGIENRVRRVQNEKAREQHHADQIKIGLVVNSDALAGSDTTTNSRESADQTDWMGRVKARIVANIDYTTSSYENEANSRFEFTVRLSADGAVSGMQNAKVSDSPEFDEAVRQAIVKSQPFPPDSSGKVPGVFVGVIHPTDIKRIPQSDALSKDE